MAFKVYGEDLANLEDEQKKLEEEKARLEDKSWPIRKLHEKRKEKITQEIVRLGYEISSTREHVRSDPASAASYERIRKKRDLDKQVSEKTSNSVNAKAILAQQPEEQKLNAEVKHPQSVKVEPKRDPRSGLPEISTEEMERTATPQKQIDEAKAYLDERKRKRMEQALKDPYMAPEKRQKILESEYEPE